MFDSIWSLSVDGLAAAYRAEIVKDEPGFSGKGLKKTQYESLHDLKAILEKIRSKNKNSPVYILPYRMTVFH
ncbi:MAG: hypothetical protein II399_05640 [Lachnospiraceae bacterium]|nr:hypothetical protein [Lachnospiraceae bacterium]